MLGLVVTPGVPGSARLQEITGREPPVGVQIRALEVGVCGTDREISAGEFGVAPEGTDDLVLGHELLGEVMTDGLGFSAGDLVTATVRRSCGMCEACAQDSPDACGTGEYTERGITGLDGYAREVIREDPAHLIPVPKSLGRLGVLAEPGSICARALRQVAAVGNRQVWRPKRALVIGAGAIGVLATFMLRLDGYEVWTVAREPANSTAASLVEASGARYVSTQDSTLTDVGNVVGGFDVVIACVGDAQTNLESLGLLRRNGVSCLLGLDGRPGTTTLPGTVVGIDTVLQNRVLFGSVNAHPQDWASAVSRLDQMNQRWGDALASMVGLRVSPDRFADAFNYSGVKATVQFDL